MAGSRVKRTASHPVTSRAVVDAAAEVFTENGYGGATLDRIAQRLGLTRQGVLHHFPSKDAVFYAVLRREQEWAESLSTQPITAENARTRLLGLRAFAGSAGEGRRHIRLIQVLQGEAIAGNSAAQSFIEERMAAIVARIVAMMTVLESTGQLAEPWDVHSASVCLVALVQGLQSRSLMDPDEDVDASYDRFVETLVKPQPVIEPDVES